MKKGIPLLYVLYYIVVALITIITSLIDFNLLFIYLGLISLSLGVLVQFIEKRILDQINHNLSTITQIDFLYEEEFYSKWKNLVNSAQHSVDITHLGLMPPLRRVNTSQSDYYNQLKKIYESSKAIIRRVERISLKKIEWIEGLIDTMQGVSNFSLFCLEDKTEHDTTKEMSDFISVQRVDEDILFLIAMTEHSSTSSPRDIYIKSKRLCEYFNNYYDTRLIKQSAAIIQEGRYNENEWLLIKERLAK